MMNIFHCRTKYKKWATYRCSQAAALPYDQYVLREEKPHFAHVPFCTYSLGTALRGRKSPASESISHISGVARSATEAVVEVTVVRGAAVVKTGSTVELAATVVTGCTLSLGQSLLETIAREGPAGTITDHLGDLAGRAGILARAAARAVVRLHEAGVADAVVGGGHANAALALLHHDGEDETTVHTRLAGDLGDDALDVADLVVRVVGAPAVPAARLCMSGTLEAQSWSKEPQAL